MGKMKVAVMASGGGTNLQKLLDRFPDTECGGESARVSLVVANRPGIGALERAAKAGVETQVADPAAFETPEAFGAHLLSLYSSRGIELIVLAGYLKLLPSNLIQAYRDRIINIHPALLPNFGGTGMFGHRVHEAVLASGVKVSGCTVHFVNERYDKGQIVAQIPVPVYFSDNPETLARRVLEQEHRLLPSVVDLIARGKVRVVGDLVQLDEEIAW